MTSHPCFEEIIQLVFPQATDPQYFSLAARVNAHLCTCEDCKKIYDVLITARLQAEDLYYADAHMDA